MQPPLPEASRPWRASGCRLCRLLKGATVTQKRSHSFCSAKTLRPPEMVVNGMPAADHMVQASRSGRDDCQAEVDGSGLTTLTERPREQAEWLHTPRHGRRDT